MDSLEAYNKHDEEQKNSAWYKALMISIACILVVVGFFAMIQIWRKLTALRNQTRPVLKRLAIIWLIMGWLIGVFLIGLNYRWKINEKNKNIT